MMTRREHDSDDERRDERTSTSIQIRTIRTRPGDRADAEIGYSGPKKAEHS